MKSCWSQACQLSTIKITSPGSPGPSCTCCSRRCRTPCTSCNLKLLRPGHPDPECTWSSPCTACSHRRHHPANKAVRAAVCTQVSHKPKQHRATTRFTNACKDRTPFRYPRPPRFPPLALTRHSLLYASLEGPFGMRV